MSGLDTYFGYTTAATQPRGLTMSDIIEAMEKVRAIAPRPQPMNVVTSPYAYKVITVWRGMQSAQKPNSRRPFYRQAKKTVYLSYFVKGLGIVCHPAVLDQIKKRFGKAD